MSVSSIPFQNNQIGVFGFSPNKPTQTKQVEEVKNAYLPPYLEAGATWKPPRIEHQIGSIFFDLSRENVNPSIKEETSVPKETRELLDSIRRMNRAVIPIAKNKFIN